MLCLLAKLESVAGIARDPGIKENLLRHWKKEVEEYGGIQECMAQ